MRRLTVLLAPFWVVSSLVWVVSSLAIAQTSAPTGADEQLARRFFALGEELYNRADYRGALKQFRQAYKHAPKSALLFNIGRCHESLGEFEQANVNYRRYLATNPPDPEQVQARVRNLERELERRARQRQALERAAAKERPPATRPPTEPTAAAPVDPERQSIHQGSLFGWIVAGSGAALLGSSLVFGALARGKASDLEQASANGSEYSSVSDLESSGKALETAQIVTMAVGGAAVVAGGVLLFLHYRGRLAERRSAWVVPTLGPGHAAIRAGLRF